MIAVLRKAETQKHDRRFQVLFHCHDRSDRSALSDESRVFTERGSHRIAGCICVWPAVRSHVRSKNRLRNHLHIGIALLDECFDKFHDPVRVLIRYEAHADFRFRFVGDRRFNAGTGVAANDPVNFERRTCPEAAGDVGIAAFPHFLQLVSAFELLRR